MNRNVIFFAMFGLLTVTTACAQEDPEMSQGSASGTSVMGEAEAEKAIESQVNEVTEQAENTEAADLLTEAIEAKPEASAIMSEPLDGSSVEAFKASLQTVKEKARPQEYRLLRGAIGNLLTYDLAVAHNQEAAYAKINGWSPEEVIERYQR